jgi:hypothetical protein
MNVSCPCGECYGTVSSIEISKNWYQNAWKLTGEFFIKLIPTPWNRSVLCKM